MCVRVGRSTCVYVHMPKKDRGQSQVSVIFSEIGCHVIGPQGPPQSWDYKCLQTFPLFFFLKHWFWGSNLQSKTLSQQWFSSPAGGFYWQSPFVSVNISAGALSPVICWPSPKSADLLLDLASPWKCIFFCSHQTSVV